MQVIACMFKPGPDAAEGKLDGLRKGRVVRQLTRRWLLLAAAVLLLTGIAPVAPSAEAAARPLVAGANHAVPDDVQLHVASLPRPVDRGTAPERTGALDLVPVTASSPRRTDVAAGTGRAGHSSWARAGSDAWGRAPPAYERVPHPS
jgi:hypothetical protein